VVNVVGKGVGPSLLKESDLGVIWYPNNGRLEVWYRRWAACAWPSRSDVSRFPHPAPHQARQDESRRMNKTRLI